MLAPSRPHAHARQGARPARQRGGVRGRRPRRAGVCGIVGQGRRARPPQGVPRAPRARAAADPQPVRVLPRRRAAEHGARRPPEDAPLHRRRLRGAGRGPHRRRHAHARRDRRRRRALARAGPRGRVRVRVRQVHRVQAPAHRCHQARRQRDAGPAGPPPQGAAAAPRVLPQGHGAPRRVGRAARVAPLLRGRRHPPPLDHRPGGLPARRPLRRRPPGLRAPQHLQQGEPAPHGREGARHVPLHVPHGVPPRRRHLPLPRGPRQGHRQDHPPPRRRRRAAGRGPAAADEAAPTKVAAGQPGEAPTKGLI
mmetsp:Transcript_12768/g.41905  ORF Transcript_12768/g.41905 Transcript_12768/m.41905 type:complete len:309 (+) Transcript_12768:509-1435(+)